MELIALAVAAVMGWRYATFGRHEFTVIAIVVLGWTTVTTLASLPYVSLEGVTYTVVFRALLLALPYGGGVLARRLADRRRRRR